MSKENVCPVCASTDVSMFFEVLDMPVHVGVQWPNQDEARHCPKGDIKLAFCHSCSFIANLAFDPARLEYAEAYDNSLHFSPFFQEYARSLATRLIERYDLRAKDVIEIGCGRGDFLLLICELGNNRGVGFDPSYEGEHPGEVAKRVTFIRDFYSKDYASYRADLICCRQVLEHIHNPTDFLTMLRRTVGDQSNTVVYFEVPNVSLILRDLSIWDIIYEHCSYFSHGSFAHAFASCGFDICDLTETYEGQFLGIEARLGNASTDPGPDRWDDFKGMTDAVAAFADHYRSRIGTWQSRLKQMEQTGQRVVVWGAGARGISFLNMLKIQDQIKYVVDINPRKQGMYMAGTGQQIVPPEFLRDYQPDVVIIINSLYKSEIQQLVKELDLTPQFLCA
jgi:SAM-dependent methyltransferase